MIQRVRLRTAGMLAALCLAAPAAVQAQNIGIYTFTGAAGDEAAFPVDAPQPANGTFSDMTRGSGLTPSVSANRFSATGWTQGTAIDPNQYYTFTLTAASGQTLNLDSLVFDERRSNTGITQLEVRSSLDNFASAIYSATVPDDANTRTQGVDLGAAFSGPTSVEFRLYGFASEATGGTWRIDNVRLVGTIGTGGGTPTQSVAFGNVSGANSATVTEQTGASQSVSVPLVVTNTGTTPLAFRITLGGTATAGADYVSPTTIRGTIPAGTATTTVPLVITVNDDLLAEPTETIEMTLDSVSTGGTIGTPATFTVNILDNDSGPAVAVQFDPTSQTVAEDAGTIQIPVTITNPSATAATVVQVMVATPAGTATDGTDYTFTAQTLTFPAGSSAPQNVTLTVIDDSAVEPTETVNLMLMGTGLTSSFTLTITDNDVTPPVPLRTIASVTQNDAAGVAVSLGQRVRLRGVVTGPNARTNGYQQVFIDRTGGITLFRSRTLAAGGTLTEGDSIEVTGTIAQFRGLTEIAADTFVVLVPGQPLPRPAIVTTTLDETTESELVQITNPVMLVSPAQWANTGTAFNADVTDGTNTYSLRILPGTSLYAAPAPTGMFLITGLGTQFAPTGQQLGGYQLVPRSLADLSPVSGLTANAARAGLSVYPNPATDRLAITAQGSTAVVLDALGRTVLTTALTHGTTTVAVADLKPGVYTVRVGAAAQRFVKQ